MTSSEKFNVSQQKLGKTNLRIVTRTLQIIQSTRKSGDLSILLGQGIIYITRVVFRIVSISAIALYYS